MNHPGKWHLRLALTLIFAALLLATDGESWRGWNLPGNLAGFTVSVAILICVYLGNKLWIWFTRIILWLFALTLIAGVTAQPPPLTLKLVTGSAALAYTLWALCFSKSVKAHWQRMRRPSGA